MSDLGQSTAFEHLLRATTSPAQIQCMRLTHWALVKNTLEMLQQHVAERTIAARRVHSEHALYLYLRGTLGAEGCQAEVLWDSRCVDSRQHSVPLLIESSENGETLRLISFSQSMPDYPLQPGDRFFKDMTEADARAQSAQLLREMEDDSPEIFANLTQRFESREAAVEQGALSALQAGLPLATHATAAMFEAGKFMRVAAAPTPPSASAPPRAVRVPNSVKELPDDQQKLFLKTVLNALAPYMKANLYGNGRWPDETSESAIPTLDVLELYDMNGREISAAAWLALQQQDASLERDQWQVRSSRGIRYELSFVATWVGVRFRVFGELVDSAAYCLARLTTPDRPELHGESSDWVLLTECEGERAVMILRRNSANVVGRARLKAAVDKLDEQGWSGALDLDEVMQQVNPRSRGKA